MVAWSTTDKSANITLSGSNLVATTTSATQGAVRCDTSFTGKLYFEAYCNVIGNQWSLGWANATASLSVALGTTANSVVVQNGFNRFNNSASTGPGLTSGTLVNTSLVRIAIDTTAKLFWSCVGYGFWNGSSTADPGAGTGGVSLAAIGAGPYFPIFGAAVSGAQVTVNLGAKDMSFAPPSGFSTLDTNAQAFMATSKFLGEAILIPPQKAAVVSKFLGEAILAPPQAAVSISKFLGYAILIDTKPPPRTRSRDNIYLRF